MIYSFKKYKSIDDFVNNRPKSTKPEKYTIIHKCRGVQVAESDGAAKSAAAMKTAGAAHEVRYQFNDNCFGCLFCLMSSDRCRKDFEAFMGKDFIVEASKAAFNLEPVAPPKTLKGLKHPYMSLEKFTCVDETTNIQPWAAGLLDMMSSEESRVSMEIPVFNMDYDRNGRLDIGVINKRHFLAVESKTSLDDALKDERFIEQRVKYTTEIEKLTEDYIYLTLLGGRETDMFPPTSVYCTGKIGDKAKRFYEIIDKNNIRFITATGLWCLACRFLTKGSAYCWDNILVDIFSSPECVGLCSAGKIMRKVCSQAGGGSAFGGSGEAQTGDGGDNSDDGTLADKFYIEKI